MKEGPSSKEKLLQTAVDLIWENSYSSVSVDDICARAQVNKGSFYYAFKSKSELAIAAFERNWQSRVPVLDEIFSPQYPPLKRFDRYCQHVIDRQSEKYRTFGKMCGCPYSSVGSELSTQDEAIRHKAEEMSGRFCKYWESLIRDLVAEGIVQTQNPAELAKVVYYFLSGVLMQAKIENNPKVLDRLKPGIECILNLRDRLAAA